MSDHDVLPKSHDRIPPPAREYVPPKPGDAPRKSGDRGVQAQVRAAVEAVRITTGVATVLREFLDNPTAEHYGFELMRACGISSGSLYPTLARLEKAGWIDGHLEDIDPKVEGRPARRYYTMTAAGEFAATQALNKLASRLRLPSWSPRPSTGNAWTRFRMPQWGAGTAFGGAG
ncbi:PadR family transcriptional regulator [Nocardia farcinica]|nr:PadR family transcriptional regulator [Nocardia farcinica]MBF6434649.1 PadR family transcriptional regulator [Nocardia farcinica]MBF6505755.1 PadR family transcriptional regulator [Nocardia farcinica]